MKDQQMERNLFPVPKLHPAWWDTTSSIQLLPRTQHQRRGMKEAQEKIKSTYYKKKKTTKRENQPKKGKIILITFIHGIKQHHLPKSGLVSSPQCRIFRVTTTGGSKAGEFLCKDPLLFTYVDKHRARALLNLSMSARCLRRL